MMKVNFINNLFFVENESDGQRLISKKYGTQEGKKFELSPYEVLYLIEKEKIEVSNNKKLLSFNSIMKKKLVKKEDYIVYKDLKDRGYKVESGLKYGFSFRVYEKTHIHAIWLVEPILEKEKLKIKDFVGKNRVANSTKKKMLIAIVDTDKDVTYLEIDWLRM